MAKAVETLKVAILSSNSGWKPNFSTLAACLKYLEGENNLEAAKGLLELLKVRGLLPNNVYDKFVMNIMDINKDVSTLDLIKGEWDTLDEESKRTDGGQTEASI